MKCINCGAQCSSTSRDSLCQKCFILDARADLDPRAEVGVVRSDAKSAVPVEEKEAMSSVDHPKHYNHGTIEVIDVIENWNLDFHLGNVLKYIGRADHKANTVEDLEKAVWYLNRKIELLKR